MNHVVVDLEMNPISSEYWEEHGRHMEIIQIGAVLLDSNYHEIGHFMTLVKPEMNSIIERRYQKLTGISTEMVAEAPAFAQALDMFLRWCQSIPKEMEICQWSTSDINQIRNEMAMKKHEIPAEQEVYLENWVDFQQEYGVKLGVHDQISLTKALNYAGVELCGRAHDALDDARNTGTLLMTLRDEKLCKKALGHVIEVLNPNPFGTSLGSLLSGIQLAS